MSPEIGVTTNQEQSFTEFTACFQEVEIQKDELERSEQQIDQQITEKVAEKADISRQAQNAESKLGRLVNGFVTETVPSLPTLANAVFTIRLRQDRERFDKLSASKKMTALTEMNFEYEELVRLESIFAALEEPVTLLAVGFRKLELAEGGNTGGPMVHSSIIGPYLTIGEIEPTSKFDIKSSVHKAEGGLGQYSLPHEVLLPINNFLAVGSRTFSWGYPYGEDTWLESPEPCKADASTVTFVGRDEPVKVLEQAGELRTIHSSTQLLLGREAIVAALAKLNKQEGVDTSPIYHASRHFAEAD